MADKLTKLVLIVYESIALFLLCMCFLWQDLTVYTVYLQVIKHCIMVFRLCVRNVDLIV